MINDRATAGTTAGQSGGSASGKASSSASGKASSSASGKTGGSANGQSGERIRLTSLSPGAGCACKLPLSALDQLIATLGTGADRPGGLVPAAGNLLVGAAEGDDAAVLRLDEDRALVLTTDFFTPIVDDPRDWGRVAATNAMSDVYAMGGKPVIALNLTAWPGEMLPVEMLADVLRGGAEAAAAVLLHDAQTSGGLLIAVAPDAMDGLREDLRAQRAEAAVAGTVQAGPAGPAGRITVRARGDAGVVS